MAGPITKQIKNPKPIMVNGKWVHRVFDDHPLSTAQMKRLAEIGRRLNLHSA